MNRASVLLLLALMSFLFIQLGAQLFAITVVVSTLIESPPESLAMLQGEFAYDSSSFWDIFPNLLGILFLTTLAFNWKTKYRKWILISLVIYILSALFAIFIIGPAQNNVIGYGISEVKTEDLQNAASIWYRYDWILFSLTLITTIPLLIPVFKHLRSSK